MRVMFSTTALMCSILSNYIINSFGDFGALILLQGLSLDHQLLHSIKRELCICGYILVMARSINIQKGDLISSIGNSGTEPGAVQGLGVAIPSQWEISLC